MADEHQRNGWVIHPSPWFDAVCLVPLLAGLPFYTTRHELPHPPWPPGHPVQGRLEATGGQVDGRRWWHARPRTDRGWLTRETHTPLRGSI